MSANTLRFGIAAMLAALSAIAVADERDTILKELDAVKAHFASVKGVEELTQTFPTRGDRLTKDNSFTRTDVCTWMAKGDKTNMTWPAKYGTSGRDLYWGETAFYKILTTEAPFEPPHISIYWMPGSKNRDVVLLNFGLKYGDDWLGDLLRSGALRVDEHREDATWGPIVTLKGEKEGVPLRFDLAIDKHYLAVLSVQTESGHRSEFLVEESELVSGYPFPKKARMTRRSTVGEMPSDEPSGENLIWLLAIKATETSVAPLDDSVFELPKPVPGMIIWNVLERTRYKIGPNGEHVDLPYTEPIM
ncbi:MAG: hypothetical protein HYR64_02930 [Fimbriimonas ginsengisoli]|uniref:Uncharacterized protein n=1 Tax=Fimbriimonas ginsengisoli TaxID=1005039 RepID=A0A931PU06_FIMGI|nr:hypothetical protein [Fimbriimonas ginsengisoli]